jgi:hypothetical protein
LRTNENRNVAALLASRWKAESPTWVGDLRPEYRRVWSLSGAAANPRSNALKADLIVVEAAFGTQT